jgi:hypothetical protein
MIGRLAIAIGVVAWLAPTPDILAQEAASPGGATAAPIPRTVDGRPDFSGIWQALNHADDDLEPHQARKDSPPGPGIVDGGVIPYQSWALEQRRQNFAVRADADPREKCYTLGTPRGIYYPEPFQIFQRSRDLTLLFQFGHSVRTIHTNGTKHPDGHLDFWLGDSRGRWEGDTLVVDVIDFNGRTWLDRAGNFHSDALHLIERWRLLDANTIEYRATFDDAKVYTRPWSITVLLHRRREPNARLIENYCYTLDYEQFYPAPSTP